jgi:hypothetical protein
MINGFGFDLNDTQLKVEVHTAERVERALAEDGELARRYEFVREELAETIHLNETLGAPSERAMEKLFAAINAEEARAPRSRPQCPSGTPELALMGGEA